MKLATNKDIIGNVANNPRYDKEYGLDKSGDGDMIKQAKERTLYGSNDDRRNRITKRLQEIYAGRYGYRQTASGRWRERDEPNAAEQDRQADAINKMMLKRKAAASRERLKSKGAIPTKAGKRLFEDFMNDANRVSGKKQVIRNEKDLKQVYLAARALDDFDKFLYFVSEVW